jgi:hypothetical protein
MYSHWTNLVRIMGTTTNPKTKARFHRLIRRINSLGMPVFNRIFGFVLFTMRSSGSSRFCKLLTSVFCLLRDAGTRCSRASSSPSGSCTHFAKWAHMAGGGLVEQPGRAALAASTHVDDQDPEKEIDARCALARCCSNLPVSMVSQKR